MNQISRSGLLPVMVIALLAGGLQQGILADCDGCPKRLVTLYDVDVQSTTPSDPVELVQWWSLFFAAGGMNDAVMSDASLNCVTFLDGAIVDPSREITDTLALGLGISRRPPAGSIGGTDYVLSGTVAGAPGAYTLSLSLETSCSREQVAGGSVAFATSAEALEAGRTLAKQTLSPIATTIRQFEEYKRSSDVTIARNVSDQAIQIIPSKTRVTRGESIPVTVTLTDCDNTLLAGRTLTLTETVFHGGTLSGSENGAFTAISATTNTEGQATVNFLVGAQKGVAVLRVYFIYSSPMGCDMVAGGTATIIVEDPILPTYVISARYIETYTGQTITTSNLDFGGTGGHSVRNHSYANTKELSAFAVAPNLGVNEGIINLEPTSISFSGAKDSRITIDETGSYYNIIGQNSSELIHYRNITIGTALPTSDMSGMTFWFDPADPATNSFSVWGTYLDRHTIDEWIFRTDDGIITSYSDEYEISGSDVSVQVPFDVEGSITVVDSGFLVLLNHDTSYVTTETQVIDGGSSIISSSITESAVLEVTIRPLSEFPSAVRLPPGRKALGRVPALRAGTVQNAVFYNMLGRKFSKSDAHSLPMGVLIIDLNPGARASRLVKSVIVK